MVEGARLERVWAGNRLEGSNPSLSVPTTADRRLQLAATNEKSFSVKDSAPKRLTLLLLPRVARSDRSRSRGVIQTRPTARERGIAAIFRLQQLAMSTLAARRGHTRQGTHHRGHDFSGTWAASQTYESQARWNGEPTMSGGKDQRALDLGLVRMMKSVDASVSPLMP